MVMFFVLLVKVYFTSVILAVLSGVELGLGPEFKFAFSDWIPGFAGMTDAGAGITEERIPEIAVLDTRASCRFRVS